MTKQDKELLLKDISARLPYGVKCYAYQSKIDGNDCECYGTFEGVLYERFYLSDRVSVNGGKTYDNYYLEVKPYLRPLSSMTEKEKNQLRDILCFGYPSDDYDDYEHRGIEIKNCLYDDEEKSKYDFEDFEILKDFLLKNHLDYRGLIEKGLALPAPEGMYKFN